MEAVACYVRYGQPEAETIITELANLILGLTESNIAQELTKKMFLLLVKLATLEDKATHLTKAWIWRLQEVQRRRI